MRTEWSAVSKAADRSNSIQCKDTDAALVDDCDHVIENNDDGCLCTVMRTVVRLILGEGYTVVAHTREEHGVNSFLDNLRQEVNVRDWP